METFTIDLNQLLYFAGAIATISAAIGIITKVTKKIITNTVKDSFEKSLDKYSETFDSKIKDLNDAIQEFITNQNLYNNQIRKALLNSTRDRINQAHDYYVRKKFIGAHSLYVVEELYSSYKELGGNTFIDRQMEDLRNLEVRSAETDDSENHSD